MSEVVAGCPGLTSSVKSEPDAIGAELKHGLPAEQMIAGAAAGSAAPRHRAGLTSPLPRCARDKAHHAGKPLQEAGSNMASPTGQPALGGCAIAAQVFRPARERAPLWGVRHPCAELPQSPTEGISA